MRTATTTRPYGLLYRPAQSLAAWLRMVFLLDMPNRAPALDGLRALAALWVFDTHLGYMHDIAPIHSNAPALFPLVVAWRAGDLGVDIFFALSGFLIFKSVRRYRHGEIGHFLQKRYTRLMPAYLGSIVLALLTGSSGLLLGIGAFTVFAVLYHQLNRHDAIRRAFAWCFRNYWIYTVAVGAVVFPFMIFGVESVVRLRGSTLALDQALYRALRALSNSSMWQDGFGPVLGVYNIPTWSLSLEFAFYLGIAGLWWIRQRFNLRMRPWVAAGIPAYYLLFCFTAIPLSALHLKLPDAMRCMAFVAGVLIVYISEDPKLMARLRWLFAKAGPWALLGLVVAAYVAGSWLGLHRFPKSPLANAAYWLATDACIFVLLGAALTRGTFVYRVFGSLPARILGAISYSIFLVHFPVMEALGKLFPATGGLAIHWAASLALTLIVAVICFYFLERPYFLNREQS